MDCVVSKVQKVFSIKAPRQRNSVMVRDSGDDMSVYDETRRRNGRTSLGRTFDDEEMR